MQLDLKDPAAFALDGIRNLIASKNDSQNSQLRVTKDGIAFLSNQVGADNIDGLAFRFETWGTGNDCCGPNAAANAGWVKTVYRHLK